MWESRCRRSFIIFCQRTRWWSGRMGGAVLAGPERLLRRLPPPSAITASRAHLGRSALRYPSPGLACRPAHYESRVVSLHRGTSILSEGVGGGGVDGTSTFNALSARHRWVGLAGQTGFGVLGPYAKSTSFEALIVQLVRGPAGVTFSVQFPQSVAGLVDVRCESAVPRSVVALAPPPPPSTHAMPPRQPTSPRPRMPPGALLPRQGVGPRAGVAKGPMVRSRACVVRVKFGPGADA